MNLIEQAESDLSFTLEDADNGFGVALTLIDGQANSYPVNVQTTDIGFFIDPQTGVGVAGRQVEITVRISTLTGLGGGYPSKNKDDPWIGLYTDTNGNQYNVKVMQNRPDRKIGVYNLLLEAYKT